MDYINYVKQYPMMGQIGLGGGACSVSRFSAGGEPVPDGSTYFGDRAMIAGGSVPGTAGVNNVEIKNITSSANSSDFGDLLNSRFSGAGVSDSVRGFIAGGRDGSGVSVDMIQYHVIPVQGESAIDFGNLISARWAMSAAGDGTRAIFHGGGGSDPAHMTATTQCQKITTQTLGNATAVGSISTAKMMTFGGSNGTRGILAGGGPPGNANTIEYITIATLGNTSDFGDLNQGNASGAGTSSPTRGVISGMKTPTVYNTIEYIEIATTGNAKDFGDLTEEKSVFGACSNAHGGL